MVERDPWNNRMPGINYNIPCLGSLQKKPEVRSNLSTAIYVYEKACQIQQEKRESTKSI